MVEAKKQLQTEEVHCSPSGNSMVGEGGGNEIGYFATLAA